MHDPRLSYRANGLLSHLRTLPPGPIDTAGLAHPERREGRDAVRSMLRELATAGHVEEHRNQDRHGHWRTTTHLVTPGTEKPGPATPEHPNQQATPEPGNPAPEHPAPEKPLPATTTSPQVTPETDCPAPEKPGPSTSTPVGSRSSSSSVVNNQTQSAARFTRTPTRAALEHLNATAVTRPDSHTLVSTWAHTLTPPIRTTTQRELAHAIDQLRNDLRADVDPNLLRAALDDWATRGRSPAFLKHCYDDAAQAARAATMTDVRASRVHQQARPVVEPTKRVRKAMAALHPDDPFLSQFGTGHAALPPGELRVIDGGMTA